MVDVVLQSCGGISMMASILRDGTRIMLMILAGLGISFLRNSIKAVYSRSAVNTHHLAHFVSSNACIRFPSSCARCIHHLHSVTPVLPRWSSILPHLRLPFSHFTLVLYGHTTTAATRFKHIMREATLQLVRMTYPCAKR